MAFNETRLTVVGRVASDVGTRTTADGVAMASFQLASNERRYDRDTGTWVDGETLFLKVTCWRRLAEGVAVSLHKGDPVVVAGRLVARRYESDGQPRTSTELEASSVGPDLTLCTAVVHRGRRADTEAGSGATAAAEAAAAVAA